MPRSDLLLAAAAIAAVLVASPAGAQTPIPMATPDFVRAASESDQFEILEGRTAVVQSHAPAVRAFAERMIRDHTRLSEALKAAAMQSGMTPPPPSLGGDQQKLLSALQSLRGPDFDRTYARQQVLAHQEALAVESDYARGGADPAIRQAARSAVPVIRSHLDMAQQMLAGMGGG